MSMASAWARVKYKYLNMTPMGKLCLAILALVGLYITPRLFFGSKNKYGIVRHIHDTDDGDVMSQPEIDAYMRAIVDTRPQFCHGRTYGSMMPDRASILLDYNEEQFYDLKLTLQSIVQHTPEFLIEEILLLDDGSVKEAVRKHALSYLRDPKFHQVKAFRSDEAHGPSLSRFKISKVATGSILVFVSSSVVVSAGWLEPLIEAVRDHRRAIAVPHHDNLLPGQRFYRSDENVVNIFSWTLTTVHTELFEEPGDRYMDAPAMRGDIFAVDRQYFHDIGDYDDGLDGGGGHNLELSIRAWLCGGGLHVVPCSRVAVHSTFKPLQVNSSRNFRRIAELWLGDYKEYAYAQSNVSKRMSDTETHSLTMRNAFLRKMVRCKNFEWYVNSVVPDLIIPSDNMVQFGKVRSKAGFCIRSVSDDKEDVDLVLCRPHMYSTNTIFELDNKGLLRMGERCLEIRSEKRLQLRECVQGNARQVWLYNNKRQFVSAEIRTNCLTHIQLGNELKVEKCASKDNFNTWSFIKY